MEGISASVDSTGYDNEVQVDELEVICTASYTACSCTKKIIYKFSLASRTTCS